MTEDKPKRRYTMKVIRKSIIEPNQTKTFLDCTGKWIEYKTYSELNKHYCKIKKKDNDWRIYGSADTEIKAIAEARKEWNLEREHEAKELL